MGVLLVFSDLEDDGSDLPLEVREVLAAGEFVDEEEEGPSLVADAEGDSAVGSLDL